MTPNRRERRTKTRTTARPDTGVIGQRLAARIVLADRENIHAPINDVMSDHTLTMPEKLQASVTAFAALSTYVHGMLDLVGDVELEQPDGRSRTIREEVERSARMDADEPELAYALRRIFESATTPDHDTKENHA